MSADKTLSFERLEKLPPHNIEAEQSLLGAMLLSPEVIQDISHMLHPDAFYTEAHRLIFEATVDLHNRGEPSDPVTVGEYLKAKGQLEQVGGKPYLHTLVSVVPSVTNAPYYAKIVERNADLRALIRAAHEIAALGYEGPEDAKLAIDRAEALIYAIAKERIRSDFISIDRLLHKGFEAIERLGENPEHITGIATGYPDLDQLTAGLQRGDLIIVAARPSIGKTALALNIATNIGLQNIPVALFSLEMSKEQLTQRIMCAEAKINAHRLRTANLKEGDWRKLSNSASRLSDAPIFIDDTPAIGILEVRSKARRLFSAHNPGVVIVDYLQLMQSSRRVENRQQEIAEISRGLKILAKELECPVIALSQLSRAVEQRGRNAKPQLSDLRESGAIEQDADLVMFIHRTLYADSEDPEEAANERRQAELILAKHRNGPIGIVKLTYLEEFARFESRAWDN